MSEEMTPVELNLLQRIADLTLEAAIKTVEIDTLRRQNTDMAERLEALEAETAPAADTESAETEDGGE